MSFHSQPAAAGRHLLAEVCRLSAAMAMTLVVGAGFGLANAQAQANGSGRAPLQVCSELQGRKILPSAIGLPTSGGLVMDAKLVEAVANGPGAHGAFCFVTGRIAPINTSAPDIVFHLALPDRWNGKAVMLGGGGFDGSFATNEVTGTILNSPADAPTPLARGYAVFSSDGGHQSKSPLPMTDGAFAMNDEAYRNWMGDALKKTRDTALVLVQARYGRAPSRSYFLGASTGGREALAVAGRWPKDWNGVVALYPAREVTTTFFGQLGTERALAAPGAYPSRAKRSALFRAALQACDGLDGVQDGVISDVRGCRALFHPATAMLDGKPLRCPSGQNDGDICLSDAEIAALNTIDRPMPIPAGLATGVTEHPGYNVLTSDTGVAGASPLEGVVTALALGDGKPDFPSRLSSSFTNQFADNWARYALARNASFDPMTIDPAHPGVLWPRLVALSSLDTVDYDLTAFSAHGGKLLLLHGTDDLLISPRGTEVYYAGLKTRMGVRRVNHFLRFYEVPGFGHSQSTVFNAAWDTLTALEGWVERGVDPAHNQVVADTVGVPGRTRPLCLYPTWARYNGSGPVNEATSFRCAAD